MALLRRNRALALGLVFTLGLLPPRLAVAAAMGIVAWVHPAVEARQPGMASQPVTQGYAVQVGEEVRTDRGAGAKVIVGPPRTGGRIDLGPETRVVFEQWLFDAANDRITEAGWRLQVGYLRAFFTPTPEGRREVWITTPTAKRIRLIGTALQVEVAPDGTTIVWVIEGEARVEPEAGGEAAAVTVPAGTWTVIAPGRVPAPPTVFDPETAAQSPDAGGPAFPRPVFTEPPELDVQRLRLDLPKEGPP
ncbi:MAG TPA: hypothetical protein VMW27_14435 [Thermoanaerobaculia bacterium]|nr:hypothetical protein [Thermoanaerobaculia bacterium]